VVVQGEAVATLDDVETIYKVGEVVNVPVGTKHRVENRQDEDLKFIEVQVGTYFGEDDIVRLEDDYGREGTNV
jgi:mannose-6-phosphate isomerase